VNDFISIPVDSKISDYLALAGKKAGTKIEGPIRDDKKWRIIVKDETEEVVVEVDTSTGGSIQII